MSVVFPAAFHALQSADAIREPSTVCQVAVQGVLNCTQLGLEWSLAAPSRRLVVEALYVRRALSL